MKDFILTSLLCLGMVGGCQIKQPDPKPEPQSQAAQPETSAQDLAAEKARHERDRAQAKKLADEGQLLPPRATVKFEVTEHNDKISLEDAGHSYEFVQASIRSCYMRVLAFDLDAKGEISLALESAPNHTCKCTVKNSSIHAEDFEQCVQKAAQHWPLPDGSIMDVKLTFDSTPAPTVEEIRKINHELEHNGEEHLHGNDHE